MLDKQFSSWIAVPGSVDCSCRINLWNSLIRTLGILQRTAVSEELPKCWRKKFMEWSLSCDMVDILH
uniref:Bm13562 n=1 Tax=Brugia malayi TaxID=6279 RepID=A0A1I9GDG8_BRUMA|nr:Bm13562 [Brugia malayi]